MCKKAGIRALQGMDFLARDIGRHDRFITTSSTQSKTFLQRKAPLTGHSIKLFQDLARVYKNFFNFYGGILPIKFLRIVDCHVSGSVDLPCTRWSVVG